MPIYGVLSACDVPVVPKLGYVLSCSFSASSSFSMWSLLALISNARSDGPRRFACSALAISLNCASKSVWSTNLTAAFAPFWKIYIKIKYNIIIKLFINRNLFRPLNVNKRNYLETILEKSKYSEVKKEFSANNLYIYKINNKKVNWYIYLRVNINYHEENRS